MARKNRRKGFDQEFSDFSREFEEYNEPSYKTGFHYIKSAKVDYKTNSQRKCHDIIKTNTLSFIGGVAGTGKSFFACVEAVEALKSGKAKKIILSRPMVEASKTMGHLPGSQDDKIKPYLLPLLDNFEILLGEEGVKKLLEDKVIRFEPINFLRGRTLRDSFVILDEMQNATKSQLKLAITRLGENSQCVVTYDGEQVDIKVEDSCINDIPKFLYAKNIGHFEFSSEDVVRSEIVSIIIEIYNKS
jgi:phosphate starvation-inducible PhoH-like protein